MEIKIKKAKTQLAVLRIFKIIGILVLLAGIYLIYLSFMDYLGMLQGAISYDQIFDIFIEYMEGIFKDSLLLYAGIALTIVFSVLTAKKRKLVKSLKKELSNA